jgi:hypothetical protein
MYKRLKRLIDKKWFEASVKNIRFTKPIQTDNASKRIVVSLLYHDALDMSLLALKSFLSKSLPCRVELLDDGSLTENDYETLCEHLQGVQITHVKDVDVKTCPRGSCWERLVHIINLSAEGYVIQVDTDTLTLGTIYEIEKHVENNTAFRIGGPQWPEPVTTDYLAKIVGGWRSDHVQTHCEAALHKTNTFSQVRYLRGCAAFSGFPKGKFDLDRLERLSTEISEIITIERWNEWGTEQFASNVMLSEVKGAEILPWPKYNNFEQPNIINNSKDINLLSAQSSLIHFIGSTRFNKGVFRRLASKVIKSLG